jgi:multiple sugar transport system substrate-binding protein
MTHDYGLSIATRWLDDANDKQLSAAQRAAGRKAYDELIATSGFPKKPDGSPMIYRTAVKLGVIFREARNKARAREFLKFLLEEENLRPYVEAARGRWFPVTRASQESPFWQADKHRKAVYEQFKAGTLPYEFTRNYRFAVLNDENVWAKAMNRVIGEGVPVDQAVEELIGRIREAAD